MKAQSACPSDKFRRRGVSAPSLALVLGLSAFLLGLAPPTAAAQDVSVQMETDRTRLMVGELFNLSIVARVRGSTGGDLALPDLSAFQLVGRQVSRPMQFSLGMGGQSSVEGRTIYQLRLRALSAGEHRIAPARLSIDGRKYESRAITIFVEGDGSAPQNDPGAPGHAPPDEDAPTRTQGAEGEGLDGMTFDRQAFLRTYVDKADAYVGEQVTASVYLYVRGQLRGSPAVTQEPSTEGFWSQDLLPMDRTLEGTQQVIDGTLYTAYLIRRFALFPLQEGALRIGPMKMEITQGSGFGLFGRNEKLVREGVPVEVKAKALPADGRPDGPVLVGRFGLEASLDRDEVATGDAVTLRTTVTGIGPVGQARIAVSAPDGLRVLSPQTQDRIETPGGLVQGTKTFEWLVVPERPGQYTIPPLTLTTFDPTSGTYREITTAPIQLSAVGRAVDEAAGANGRDESAGATDDLAPSKGLPRFAVRTRSALHRREPPLSSQPYYLLLFLLPALGTAAWVAMGAYQQKQQDAGTRLARDTRRRLDEVRSLAGGDDARTFYRAVRRLLDDVVGNKLGQPIGGLTLQQLQSRMLDEGMDRDLAERLTSEMEGCEFAQFSATGGKSDEMRHCVGRINALFERLQAFTPRGGSAS